MTKPEPIRKRYTYLFAGVIFAIIFLAWAAFAAPGIFESNNRPATINLSEQKKSAIITLFDNMKQGWKNLQEFIGK